MNLVEMGYNRKKAIRLISSHSDTIFDHCLRLILYRNDNDISRSCVNHLYRVFNTIKDYNLDKELTYKDYLNCLKVDYFDQFENENDYYMLMKSFYINNENLQRYPVVEPTEYDGELLYKFYNKLIELSAKALSSNYSNTFIEDALSEVL